MTEKEEMDPPEEAEETFVLVDRVVSPYLVCFHQPYGLHAEQYRALRNKLMAMNRSGASRSILITSAQSGDGKTVTLANLALVLGELERTRVLMLDADLRRPGLELLLGINPQPGLSDLLQDQLSLDDAIQDSGFPNVDLLGAGTKVANPGALLASKRVGELLGRLKQTYRYILIDSPPVLPITDALSMGPNTDGALVVVRLDSTPRPAVDRALSMLKGVGTTMLGVFLTCVKGMGSGYESPYHYQSDDQEEERE